MKIIPNCSICGAQVRQEKVVNGPLVTYTDPIKIESFDFYTCKKCGFSINNNFQSIDFDSIAYNNNDELISNTNDEYIENQIIQSLKYVINGAL